MTKKEKKQAERKGQQEQAVQKKKKLKREVLPWVEEESANEESEEIKEREKEKLAKIEQKRRVAAFFGEEEETDGGAESEQPKETGNKYRVMRRKRQECDDYDPCDEKVALAEKNFKQSTLAGEVENQLSVLIKKREFKLTLPLQPSPRLSGKIKVRSSLKAGDKEDAQDVEGEEVTQKSKSPWKQLTFGNPPLPTMNLQHNKTEFLNVEETYVQQEGQQTTVAELQNISKANLDPLPAEVHMTPEAASDTTTEKPIAPILEDSQPMPINQASQDAKEKTTAWTSLDPAAALDTDSLLAILTSLIESEDSEMAEAQVKISETPLTMTVNEELERHLRIVKQLLVMDIDLLNRSGQVPELLASLTALHTSDKFSQHQYDAIKELLENLPRLIKEREAAQRAKAEGLASVEKKNVIMSRLKQYLIQTKEMAKEKAEKEAEIKEIQARLAELEEEKESLRGKLMTIATEARSAEHEFKEAKNEALSGLARIKESDETLDETTKDWFAYQDKLKL